MSMLWTGGDIAAQMQARALGALPAGIGGLSIDTRSLLPGDAFFAIQGEARDGHDFVANAFAAGAGLAVVDEAHAEALRECGPLLAVPDVLAGLIALARASRRRSMARIVAVTGSVGKTGTKEALKHVLARQGATHASVASYNNHWGVPLTLARMPAETAYGIFEIGMNHSFEILPLTAMVRPHVAVVTTVEPVHLAYFPDIAAIADAKGEIFSGLMPGGTAIINRDNPHFARLAAHAAASPAGRIVTFGAHEAADIRLVSAGIGPEASDVSVTLFGRPLAYRIGSPGRHTVMNSLAVLGAVAALGGDAAEAALSLADLSPPEGRGARVRLPLGAGEITLIDESYNANPASMRAALAVLAGVPLGSAGRRIAVMGDMLELGPEAARHHSALADAVRENGIDLVFACGPEMKHLWDGLPAAGRGAYASASSELGETLVAALRPGDAVMIKGSFGSRMGPLVTLLKQRLAGATAQGAGQ